MKTTSELALVAVAIRKMTRWTDSDSRIWAEVLSKRSGVTPDKLAPMLEQMTREGWLEAHEEEHPVKGRSPRRYYTVTDKGRESLTGIIPVGGIPFREHRLR